MAREVDVIEPRAEASSKKIDEARKLAPVGPHKRGNPLSIGLALGWTRGYHGEVCGNAFQEPRWL